MTTTRLDILLVEDDPGDARLIREALAGARLATFRASCVTNWAETEAALSESQPDAILLDLQLPDSRGLDTLGRAQEAAPAVPVIVLTGMNDENLGLEAVQAGAQDYLLKGETDTRLVERSLLYAVERKATEERLRREATRLESIVSAQQDIAAMASGVDNIAHSIVHRTAEITGGAGAAVLLFEDEGLVVRASARIPSLCSGAWFPADAGSGSPLPPGEVMRCDETTEAPYGLPLCEDPDVRSGLLAPFRQETDVVGLLAVTAHGMHGFDEDDIRALQLMAEAMGTALSHARRFEAERALHRESAFAKTLLEAESDLGIGVLRGTGDRITFANDAALRILGREASDPEHLPPAFDLIHEEERDLVLDHARRRARGEPAIDRFENTLVRPDGERVVAQIFVKALEGSDGRGWVMVLTDVTEERRQRDRLAESERRYATAYEKEQEATERLRALNDMKNAFLTAVSHELRTPLTSVLGFADTLADHDDKLSVEQRRTLLDRLCRNATKLQRLLGDLLDIDRLSRGVLEPERTAVDVTRLARGVLEGAPIDEDRPVSVEGDEVVAQVDPAQVERILENLLANALKHTPRGTPIWIRVEDRRDGVCISVEDAGPGLPSTLREEVFEPFHRGPNAPEHEPGVGIGLSLVSQFAELHGGRAWADEREGGGAAFHVYLPEPAADGESDRTEDEAHPQAWPYSITQRR